LSAERDTAAGVALRAVGIACTQRCANAATIKVEASAMIVCC